MGFFAAAVVVVVVVVFVVVVVVDTPYSRPWDCSSASPACSPFTSRGEEKRLLKRWAPEKQGAPLP